MQKDVISIHEVIVKNFLESIRPDDLEIRKELDLRYSYDGEDFEIFEISADFMKPEEVMHNSFAKFTYVGSKDIWKLYWMRGNLKWVLYKEFPRNTKLDVVLQEINEDKQGCFYG